MMYSLLVVQPTTSVRVGTSRSIIMLVEEARDAKCRFEETKSRAEARIVGRWKASVRRLSGWRPSRPTTVVALASTSTSDVYHQLEGKYLCAVSFDKHGTREESLPC